MKAVKLVNMTLNDIIKQGYVRKQRLDREGYTHSFLDFVSVRWQLCGNCRKRAQCPVIQELAVLHNNYHILAQVVLCDEGFEAEQEALGGIEEWPA